ncbi:MAG: efflux RND transporter periplasmic adaptor subunit [Gammaproteobacteria bacterium]|nr:efflux RND transporter periplasmic adaptor subunit [Gammaproteobacteria bacterium]
MRGLAETLCIAGFCTLGACSQSSAPSVTGGVRAAPALALATTLARTQTVAAVVTVPGTVTRASVVRLASPYGGLVGVTPAAVGARVGQGKLLLTVGAADARARLAAAAANAAASRAEAAQAAADEDRFRALRAQGAVAPREYEQVHQRYVSAQARARAVARALAAARTDLQYAEIRAPFDGLLIERAVKPGDYAAPGSTLAVMVGGEPQVELQVGETVFPELPLGATPTVAVQGHRYDATVIERVDAADPMTRVHRVKLRLIGAPPPPYGTYAEVRVTVGQRRVVVVPGSAVVERAGLTGVFVVDARGFAHFRPVRNVPGEALGCGADVTSASASPAPDQDPDVTPGTAGVAADQGCITVISAGLAPGEPVVTTPPLALGNGDRVEARADRG